MKKFRFKQEAVLRLRRQLRRQAELKLLQAEAALRQAESEYHEMQIELERLALTATVSAVQRDAMSWLESSRMLQAQAGASKRNVEARRQEKDACLTKLNQATLELEAIEALHQRQWERFRRDQLQTQAESLDEIAIRQWYQLMRKA